VDLGGRRRAPLARVRLHGVDGTGSIANQAERDGEQGTGRERARGEDPQGGLPRKLRPQRDGDTGGPEGGEVGDGAAGGDKDGESEPDRHGERGRGGGARRRAGAL